MFASALRRWHLPESALWLCLIFDCYVASSHKCRHFSKVNKGTGGHEQGVGVAGVGEAGRGRQLLCPWRAAAGLQTEAGPCGGAAAHRTHAGRPCGHTGARCCSHSAFYETQLSTNRKMYQRVILSKKKPSINCLINIIRASFNYKPLD